eukprot:3275481-Amphidinium_carterae.2
MVRMAGMAKCAIRAPCLGHAHQSFLRLNVADDWAIPHTQLDSMIGSDLCGAATADLALIYAVVEGLLVVFALAVAG